MAGWPRFPGGIRLARADWQSILETYGAATLVRRATRCGCIDAETLKPEVMCDVCHGFGWQYPAALEVTAQVQWTGGRVNHRQQAQGDVAAGDYTVTWVGHTPGTGDVFVHPSETIAAHQVMIRGAMSSAGLGATSLEIIAHRVVIDIEHVADSVATYEEGVDFSLAGDGRTLEWEPGRGPAAGAAYSVRCNVRGEYVIASDAGVSLRHDGPESLPFRATLHRYDPVAGQAGRNLTDQ